MNRLLLTYLNAALEMVMAGAALQQIDAAMVEFGMPLGPLELLDEIGLDTIVQSGIVLAEIFGGRSAGSELLVRLVKARQLGKKVGAGFYRYPEPGAKSTNRTDPTDRSDRSDETGRSPNPSLGEIAQKLGASANLRGEKSGSAEIASRLLRPMIAEASRVLVEKKVASAWEVDLATIFGLGFPLCAGAAVVGRAVGIANPLLSRHEVASPCQRKRPHPLPLSRRARGVYFVERAFQ